jgi:predicted homoserine dehydrogenase-like protein
VTPAGVWGHYGLTAAEAQSAGMNPQMFNSFLDGTKSAIEMAAIANATGLDVPSTGLLFPPCGVDDLPHVMRPTDKGGVLEKSGVVEVVSSLERDGRPVFAICAGASMSCWKRRTTMRRIVSASTA